MRTELLALGLAAGLLGCAHKGAGRSSDENTARSHEPSAARAKKAEPDIDAGRDGAEAAAELEPRSRNTTLSGHVALSQTTGGVKLVLHVTGAPPGQHGAHIHEAGDCSDAEAKRAGGHWNPAGHKHGAPPPSGSHLGDLGNLEVGADGTGHLELVSDAWTIGDGSVTDVKGRAVVIHAGSDDLKSDPAGNSGARIGCGVIR